ncbi:TetR/AcrR family transcriptional regulator [Streptococcus parauberis]|uniref:TetR/AcrR family transcriptional regulator n=1 Tax=Streptococcus parauberis TaxID=1348 RepID=UPI000C145CEA|nr:TetR/AcrR family transcriptional regulator [Streptococcus parauberis]PIA86081.1 Nucleoid occlusion factor SlmA [Streptococcus parauberis]
MSNRKENTKKALLDAMVELLSKESFDDITTKRLAETAGISRSSFYTHYKDKYEMIDSYQQMLSQKLEFVFEKDYGNREQIFLEIFKFLAREKLLSALVSANGTRELQSFIINRVRLLIKTDLQEKITNHNMTEQEKDYQSIYLAYAFFGTCQAWVAKGKKESPEEMTQFVLKMLSITD